MKHWLWIGQACDIAVYADDCKLREAMKAVAAQRRRFGYRRIHEVGIAIGVGVVVLIGNVGMGIGVGIAFGIGLVGAV